MKFVRLIIAIVLFTSGIAQSQNLKIAGKIVDENDSVVVGAVVKVLNLTDSSLVKGAVTDIRGRFIIESLNAQDYLLHVSFLGYEDLYKKISVSEDPRIGRIKLKPSAKILKEVEVNTNAVIATQNGDTTSFNSKAFKTNKDASAEELLTKMPGITNEDGKVKAQGEDVKQILVDGKPFFGDDPNAVLKNLPAEVIEKVQVFDKKSDQSQFTGFDDGNTSKTINIITKSQFRNGIFGRTYGGYGYEDKYKAGAVINRFKDKQRFTVMAMSNNVNEQNFSTEDLLGVMSSNSSNQRGGGGNRGGGSGGNRSGGNGQQNNSDNFLVNIKNGISTTNAFGMNYSDNWGKNTSITASYFFNQSINKANSDLIRNYIVGNNNGLSYTEDNYSKNTNYNHRLSVRLEHKIDSFNSVILQPKLSLQTNSGLNEVIGNNARSSLISSISNNFNSSLNGYNISFPALLRHAFAKKGRTVSLDLNPSVNSSKGDSKFISYNTYYENISNSDTIDQRSSLTKNGLNTSSNLLYTEPIGKYGFLSANYMLTYNSAESNKNTYNKSSITNDYTTRDSLMSNVFDNTYVAHLAGINYRFQKEKYNFSFGISAQQAELKKNQFFPESTSNSKVFNSVLPNAQYQYKFNSKNNFRINYRTSNTPPSIEQLQNVLNNSNPLQLSIGNPDLKQNFQNNLNMRYTGVNTSRSTSLFILLGGSYTNNYIGNSTIIADKDTTVFGNIFLAKGSQISRQENLDNNYSLRFFFNYSFPVKFLKSNLNINTGCNYSNIPALINNKTNYSKTTSPSAGLVLSSNISEKIDFTLSSTSSYNNVINSLQTTLNSSYLNQISKATVNITLFKKIVLRAEYSNNYYNGLNSAFNQNINLLNGAVAVKLFKENQGELRLYVFDVLNQNQSIQRNITETYIEDSHTTILQRYFMLTFTYNIKKYFQKKEAKQ